VTEAQDWNSKIIAEFPGQRGQGRRQFRRGHPSCCCTTVGAKSGQPRVHPMMYQDIGDGVAVFRQQGGRPDQPGLVPQPAGQTPRSALLEIGAGNGRVHRAGVAEGRGGVRRIWTAQKRDYPGFAGLRGTRRDRQNPG